MIWKGKFNKYHIVLENYFTNWAKSWGKYDSVQLIVDMAMASHFLKGLGVYLPSKIYG